ncbi:geranylgeranyl diphosphate synthase, type II [Evansella caseinilytica]|uniref:Farnesyl diphosphate synthase n=1 Tax=Evansella caseinilytica TaxID=1503961 RepID=A0A1H3KYE6_9BACI|nr:farnesyl diphosphate synthase [Evansella caseinilytica]SDY56675.1 geranylgeranyl diphosphate synthase, type II [Evansella caseinilytica]
MPQVLAAFLQEAREKIEQHLPEYIEGLNAPTVLKEAMTYSLKAGGKRLRPILVLATLKSYGKPLSLGYQAAAAIEMIHTYSLVHDDLPAMDDDDLRRGKPTNHKVYGEAMAILAGDGLLTYSFQLLASANMLSTDMKLELIRRISQAAGPAGMVGGQVKDMLGEGRELDAEQLQQIHHHKTGELLSVSVEAGAIIAAVPEKEKIALREFGKQLGIAFQIKDDILDVEGDVRELGKPVGSDEVNNKSTYPKLLGLAGAKEKLLSHIAEAKKCLYKTSMDHTLLIELTDYIGTRTK